jgi:hypothetical protein
LLQADNNKDLRDFYTIGLWNYCEGDYKDGKYETTHCNGRKAKFWFNPVEVWGLNGTGVEDEFPDELQKGLDIYRKVSGWMFVAYAVAFFATIAELVVGISAIFSRWGSLFTTLVSGVCSSIVLQQPSGPDSMLTTSHRYHHSSSSELPLPYPHSTALSSAHSTPP